MKKKRKLHVSSCQNACRRKRTVAAAGMLLFIGGILTGCGQRESEPVWNLQKSQRASSADSEVFTEIITEICTESGTEQTEHEQSRETDSLSVALYADICGAVQVPGVYEVKEGARICELIAQAGGLLENADLTTINQAEKVTDGMKVRVYTKEEAEQFPIETSVNSGMLQSTSGDDKININCADVSQLTQLSGIGNARAEDIIAYRTEHGGFQTTEEIMNVSGIKESTFQKIKDQIVVK